MLSTSLAHNKKLTDISFFFFLDPYEVLAVERIQRDSRSPKAVEAVLAKNIMSLVHSKKGKNHIGL